MNEVDRLQRIPIGQLDQEQFFQSLFQEICRKNLLTKERIERIQLELIELLGNEVERYTNGESTSLPVEKAQEILQSITYSLGIYLKEITDEETILEVLNTEKISAIFYKGMETIEFTKKNAKQLLKDLQKNRVNINNYAYQDTLTKGVDEFFRNYQTEFRAFDTPANIDYQLLCPVEKLTGVEYIFEYLRRFKLENDFIRRFDEESIGRLLYGFHVDSEHMLINIYELLLTNAMGCAVLEKNIKILDISAVEIKWLQNKLTLLNDTELRDKLMQALNQVTVTLGLDTDEAIYAQAVIAQLAVRLRNNLKTDTLGEIFVSFTDRSVENGIIIEGIPMEDAKLRVLIEELKEIPSIPEKMIKIRETVQSLEDLTELLNECFYEDEYEELFWLFGEQEIAILKEKIISEAAFEGGADYESYKPWQKTLLRY